MRDREPLYNPITPPPKSSWLSILMAIAVVCVGVVGLIIVLEEATGRGF